MVPSSPTAVLRWVQRSSTTVMRATSLESGGHHSARRMECGHLTQHYSTVLLVCPLCNIRMYKALHDADKLSSTCINMSPPIQMLVMQNHCVHAATCDTPELPKEAVVTVNGTREGSRMRITCQNGMGGAEFACNKQGQWYLDPAEYGCRDHDIHPGTLISLHYVSVCCSTWYILFNFL